MKALEKKKFSAQRGKNQNLSSMCKMRSVGCLYIKVSFVQRRKYNAYINTINIPNSAESD